MFRSLKKRRAFFAYWRRTATHWRLGLGFPLAISLAAVALVVAAHAQSAARAQERRPDNPRHAPAAAGDVAQHFDEQGTLCGSHAIGQKSPHEAQAAAIENTGREQRHDLAAARAVLVEHVALPRESEPKAIEPAHRPVDFFVVQEIVLLHETYLANELRRYQHGSAAHEGQFAFHFRLVAAKRR